MNQIPENTVLAKLSPGSISIVVEDCDLAKVKVLRDTLDAKDWGYDMEVSFYQHSKPKLTADITYNTGDSLEVVTLVSSILGKL